MLALDKQFKIYSVDTSAFYTDEEHKIYTDMQKRYHRIREYKKNIVKSQKKRKKETDKDMVQCWIDYEKRLESYVQKLKKDAQYKNECLKNLIIKNKDMQRVIRSEYISNKHVISIFESNTTRVLDMVQNEINNHMMVVQIYYFDILQSLLKNGFVYVDPNTGEHIKYILFTASAGQIRTKKIVMIQEKLWKRHEKTFMCGLSLEDINLKGGANVNKYLAYLALSNSATDVWQDFDIDKSIVVDDMELPVRAEVDYIDNDTFDITRKTMDIPIEHTDGCGMILPKFKTSRMVRLPFVKGLLVPFPFDKFIKEHDNGEKRINHGVVKDIYGKEHDILAEGIEVIFTRSQFKMWKFYGSWDQYKEYYKKYGCTAGICNEEEEKIKDCKLNYQMLQTLTDITDDELKKLAHRTISDIKRVSSDKDTMLKVLGVTEYNKNKNYFQSALKKYPELLKDTYSKEVLKQVKKSMVTDAYCGKLETDGKYAFVVPDLYAFCEWLFLKNENPHGLLKNGEVSFNLYKDGIKVDCLRSPHLFREHPIRTNVVNEQMSKWFVTKGIYTSIKDSISKVLQFDNDGDKLIVCKDQTLVEVAERNNKNDNIMPLYYEMGKADAKIIDSESLYESLVAAFVGGSIGIVSNEITKIWNNANPDLDAVKMLCLYGNNCIDYAKTLKKPDIPDNKKKRLRQCSSNKPPHFFIYAKDKEENQVEKKNNSTVNRLINIIGKPRLKFDNTQLGNFDYRILMSDMDFIIDKDNKLHQSIIDDYMGYDLRKHNCIIRYDGERTSGNDILFYKDLRGDFDKKYNPVLVTDVLVYHLYKEKDSNFKVTLWSSFGDIINQNISKNILVAFGENSMQCEICGERVEKTKNRLYCEKCHRVKTLEKHKKHNKKRRS